MCNKIGSRTFVPTAYFLIIVSLCFGSGNAFPIAAAPSIGNSKLSGGFKRSFQMDIEYISFIMYIKFFVINLEHSEKIIDIRKLLL